MKFAKAPQIPAKRAGLRLRHQRARVDSGPDRSARVSQWFHHQSQSCKRQPSLAGQPGMARSTAIDRIGAYFEETKTPRIRPGASAEIYLMDGSPALQGTVVGISRGITDQDNKDGPELLSSINPTFTWVRLAQRIPVRVQITHVPPGVLVSAGMTCTVVMKEARRLKSGSASRKPWQRFLERLRVESQSSWSVLKRDHTEGARSSTTSTRTRFSRPRIGRSRRSLAGAYGGPERKSRQEQLVGEGSKLISFRQDLSHHPAAADQRGRQARAGLSCRA